MVGARNKGEGGVEEERKGERFCFHQSVCVVGGGGRKKTEIKTHTTSFLPFCPPSLSWTQMPKKGAKGPAFLSFFCLASSGLGSPAWPPTLLGSGFRKKEAGQEARLWEQKNGSRGRGSRHLRELEPAKWRQWQVWAESQPRLVDMEGGEVTRRAFWLTGNSVESSLRCSWEERMGREGRREGEDGGPTGRNRLVGEASAG